MYLAVQAGYYTIHTATWMDQNKNMKAKYDFTI